MDNWDSAVKIFNRNVDQDGADGVLPRGRVANLNWFDHPSEALLFYLVHFAYSRQDRLLIQRLDALGFGKFLQQLRQLDETAARAIESLADLPAFADALKLVDKKVYSLASCKSALGKLHLKPGRALALDLDSIPWTEEALAYASAAPAGVAASSPIPDYVSSAVDLWRSAVQQICSSGDAVGRGQHKVNPQRMRTLAAFFESESAEKLQSIWVTWVASRLSLREEFCLTSYPDLRRLYNSDRRVHVLLGGPPCKGFSRIGRAVIRELRSQGAHAWASNKFGDERNALMYKYVIFLEALKPDAFLFENVTNFTAVLDTPDGKLDAPTLLSELIESLDCENLQYWISQSTIKARFHAIPQARERFFMCGINKSAANESPASSVLDIRRFKEQVTLESALVGLGPASVFSPACNTSHRTRVHVDAGAAFHEAAGTYLRWIQGDSNIRTTDAHIYRRAREDDGRLYEMLAPGTRWMDLKTPRAWSTSVVASTVERMKALIPAGKMSPDLAVDIAHVLAISNESLSLRLMLEHLSHGLEEEHHLLGAGYLKNGTGSHGDWLERLPLNKPCKTVVAHIGKDTYGYIHPFEPRPITIREAARVQSFPDSFSFAGVGVVDAYSMIGNAVPPLLASQLAQSIYEVVFKNRPVSEKIDPAATPPRACNLELAL